MQTTHDDGLKDGLNRFKNHSVILTSSHTVIIILLIDYVISALPPFIILIRLFRQPF